jgi:hypothetical protein
LLVAIFLSKKQWALPDGPFGAAWIAGEDSLLPQIIFLMFQMFCISLPLILQVVSKANKATYVLYFSHLKKLNLEF